MGQNLKQGRTINWNIVITTFHCCLVNVKRILIHRTLVVVVYAAAAVRLSLVLLRFLDSHTLHPFKLEKLRISKQEFDNN